MNLGKSKMVTAFVMLLLVMGVGYAAFNTRITITTTATGAGGISVKYSCGCTGSAGLSGATLPTGTCTPVSETATPTGTMTAQLYQPGDKVTCTWTVKNYSSFRITSSSGVSCTHINSSPFKSTNTSLSKTTLGVGDTATFTVSIEYLSNVTSQPSTTTSGTVTCTVPWAQIA